jgi:hypothetical protein
MLLLGVQGQTSLTWEVEELTQSLSRPISGGGKAYDKKLVDVCEFYTLQ